MDCSENQLAYSGKWKLKCTCPKAIFSKIHLLGQAGNYLCWTLHYQLINSKISILASSMMLFQCTWCIVLKIWLLDRGHHIITMLFFFHDSILISAHEDLGPLRDLDLGLPGGHGHRRLLAGKESPIVDPGSRCEHTQPSVIRKIGKLDSVFDSVHKCNIQQKTITDLANNIWSNLKIQRLQDQI